MILHFQEAEDRSDGSTTLSLRQLASLCEVEEDELFTSGIAYWLSKGVLREISAGTGPSKSTSSGYDDYAEGPDRLFEVVEAQRGLASADLSMEGSGGAVGGVQVRRTR